MKAIYITANEGRAESLKRQLAELSPSTDLDIRVRAADARALLSSGAVAAVLTDMRLSDEDASGLLDDLRRHDLPLVVIVTAAGGAAVGSHGALYANADEYVWDCDVAATDRPLDSRSVAKDLLAAIRHAVTRRRGEVPADEKVLRTAYVGRDDQVRTILEHAPGVRMVRDCSESDVVVIDTSPYHAVPLVHTLRDTAPAVPVVLLSGTDIHDPDDVAMMLDVDRVLVKAGDWRAQLLPQLRGVARTGCGRAPTTQAAQGPAAERPRGEAPERRLDEAPDAEAPRISTLEAGSRARPLAAAAQHEPDLARRRVELEDVERWLKDAQNELRRRSSLVETVRTQSGIARRKTQLAELAVGVVTELDSLISVMIENTERATRASLLDPQLDRAGVATELDSFLREMTDTAERAVKALELNAQLGQARRAAGRAHDIARHFLLFSRWQAQAPEPTDLNTVIRDLEPTLRQLVGHRSELLVRVEPTTAPVSLGHEQIGRLLVSMALLCRDALPIGGQVVFETGNVEKVPSWDPSLSPAEPLPFVRVSATIRGHAPRPLHVTASLESLAQECDGHCDVFTTDDRSTGLHTFLPRAALDQPAAIRALQ